MSSAFKEENDFHFIETNCSKLISTYDCVIIWNEINLNFMKQKAKLGLASKWKCGMRKLLYSKTDFDSIKNSKVKYSIIYNLWKDSILLTNYSYSRLLLTPQEQL